MDGVNNQRMGSRRKELTAPCMGSQERTPGCHDSCTRGYKAYKQELEALHQYQKANQSAGELYDPSAPVRRQYY